ncbi:MAG TPA: GlsB/YeaQ/YmgE family stress response membrane protein [Actinomycetes bacterium]|nr:GlsB/YeaQ/YmgE family stress response membrane protein [Actinomycetes bacterium]
MERGILGWILIGLAAGALGRLLLPGRDPTGCLGTILLGILGSLLGGAVASWLDTGHLELRPAGLLGSVLGAIALLLLRRLFVGRPGGQRY